MAESLGSAILTLLTDDRQLDEGLDRARDRVQSAADDFQRRGERMKDIGAKLSMAITGPIAGAGAAVLAHAKAIADTVPDIENFARVAGIGTDQFQRLASAASNVGMESDALKDVFKDTNEKLGEFLATGGGEMQDFFENIAPKVGVTAAQFRNLSGPDALQLYYSSLEKAGLNQAQMTYYMEALASEATSLMPLLANGGKAFRELGASANVLTPEQIEMFKRYNSAQQEMEKSTQKLTIAIVSSGLLDGITNLVTKAADFTAEVSKTNPEMLRTAMIVAGLAAAIGPAVMGLGFLSTGFGSLLSMVATGGALRVGLSAITVALGGPVGIAILAAGVVAAFANWDKIGPWIDNVSTRMTDFQTKFDAQAKQFQSDIDAIDQRLGIPPKEEMFRAIERNFNESIQRIDAWLASVQRGAQAFDTAMAKMATDAVASARKLYAGIKTWLQDQLNAVFDFVHKRIQAVGDKFYWLWDVVVGHSYIPDMVDEIGRQMARLDAEMVSPTTAATTKAAQAFQALQQRVGPILNRLFPDQAKFNQFRRDIDDLTEYAKKQKWSADQTDYALERLSTEYAGTKSIDELVADLFKDAPTEIVAKAEIKPIDTGMPVQAQAEWREGFGRAVSDGIMSALDGNLGDFFSRWVKGGAARGLEQAFTSLADVLSGLFSGKGGGAGGLLSWLFGGSPQSEALAPSSVLGLLGDAGPVLAQPSTRDPFGGVSGGGIGRILSRIFAGGFEAGGLIPSGKFGLVGEAGPELAIPTPRGTMIQSNRSLLAAMQPAPATRAMPDKLEVSVSGARGNREISEMVAAGVREGLASYDQVVSDRVREQVARRS